MNLFHINNRIGFVIQVIFSWFLKKIKNVDTLKNGVFTNEVVKLINKVV